MAATNINIAGTVKFFDQKKGFGIITTKQGGVFIHVSRCGGKQAELTAGAEVRIDYTTAYKDGAYKHSATALLSIKPPPAPVEVLDLVKFYSEEKGYGFLSCVGAAFSKDDAFISSQVVKSARITPGKGMPMLAMVLEKNGRPEVVSFKWGPEVEAAYTAKMGELHAEDGAVVEATLPDPFAPLFEAAADEGAETVLGATEALIEAMEAAETQVEVAPKPKRARKPKVEAAPAKPKKGAQPPASVTSLAELASLVGKPNGDARSAAHA